MTGIQFIVRQMTKPKRPPKPPIQKRTVEYLEPYAEEIIHAYQNGKTVYAIAKKHGAHSGVVQKLLASKGIHAQSLKERQEIRRKLIERIKSGEITKAEAARRVGVKESTVYMWLRRDK